MWIIDHKNIFLTIGVAVMALSLVILFWFGIKPSIDFTGGALLEVTYEVRPDKSEIENNLSGLDLGGYSLRASIDEAGRDAYHLRTRDLKEEERQTIQNVMLGVGEGGEIARSTVVGPTIGQELQEKVKWAVGGVSVVILLYVALVFWGVRWPVGSTVYGGITVIALLHDILVPAAAMSLFGYFLGMEADVLFVMALLAVLGYSVNDTIVVFDRVRENIVKYRKEHKSVVKDMGGLERDEISYTFDKPFSEVVGLSVNETLLRSINTSLTTGLALVALYWFGGEVTESFALILLIGIIAGTYSSIFLASPLLVWYADKKGVKSETNA